MDKHSARGNPMKIFKPALHKKDFFTMRVINHYNKLSTDVESANSVNAFTNLLDKHVSISVSWL